MFTGIIAAKVRVARLALRSEGALLEVARPAAWNDIAPGESIDVSGVCLTVLPPADRGPLRFDLSPETLSRSTLGKALPGSGVNLERALRPSDRLGGHVVAGHVDATTPITGIAAADGFWTLSFALSSSWARYVVEKGSISLDGISLTVARLGNDGFDVAVIPHTWEVTTLSERTAGDLVNVEVDILGKYVERLLAGHLGDPEALARDGRLRQLLSEGA
ncbi:MAG: riboflavin synthase [Thermoanaerobaculia bacterium]